MIHLLQNIVGSILLLAGCSIFVITVVGIFRVKYVLNCLHVTAVSDTLGTLLVVAGLMVLRGPSMALFKLGAVLISMWFTCPISTHRIADVEVNTNLSIHEEYEVET